MRALSSSPRSGALTFRHPALVASFFHLAEPDVLSLRGPALHQLAGAFLALARVGPLGCSLALLPRRPSFDGLLLLGPFFLFTGCRSSFSNTRCLRSQIFLFLQSETSRIFMNFDCSDSIFFSIVSSNYLFSFLFSLRDFLSARPGTRKRIISLKRCAGGKEGAQSKKVHGK